MDEIFKNFKELKMEENFDKFKTIYSILEKDKNKLKNKFTEWIYKKSVDKEIFYAEIDISNLEQNELQKIDSFIKEKLELFPSFFPNISLENEKNYNMRNTAFNKTCTKKAKKLLENINSLEAVKISMRKEFTKDHLTDPSYFFKNNETEAIRKEIVSYLSKQVTIGNVIKKIKLQIKNHISKYVLEEEMNSLSNFMGIEVYFRTRKPTIYCEVYKKIEEEYNYLQYLITILIKNDIDKILTNDSSVGGIEKAKERIDEYIKKYYNF